MKHYSKKVTIKSERTRDYFAVTQQISLVITESQIQNGLVLCYAMSSNSSIFLHLENKKLLQDVDEILHKLAPEKPYSQYAFNSNRKDAASHIKGLLMGRQLCASVCDGQLELNEDDHIMYADFDGGREKSLLVKVIGE